MSVNAYYHHMEMMNGKFTFGDLNVVLYCGWLYGTLCIHFTRYIMRVTLGDVLM
ncbi:hypothetical protein MTR67_038687 [Solanum verrucosum]|uniref:Uncharacterized protein n=1 Tax=Solanum verrucosum TaxID=315347 RepID=A0AAF0ZMZ4_SOLVR|nr:hypothetical protein MTR67_038687 [Solanum verrucosum]